MTSGSRNTAIDAIRHYRDVFKADERGIDTMHAGVMWYIVALSHMIMADLEDLLKRYDLTPSDLFVIAVVLIEEGRNLRPSDVARILLVSPAAVSLKVAKLQQRGLLMREEDAKDRRIVVLRLTPDGAELAHRILAMVAAKGKFARSLRKLPVEDRNALESLLGNLSVEMRRHFAKY
ncbi:MarR family winged helix-turn-helix transcriptional regulator [Novosphingobium malaysiense]|uniref:MarR family winged helix-turn-helix transcriptional regulator n=1 Tax=Novosphingobium malaysiense TaxID=1348853 RepID=UPI00068CBBDA|nr:MarR family transcriptional regulator [Novosphingobium malaysiense]